MIDMERACLGACLIDPSHVSLIAERVQIEHFGGPGRAVWAAMLSLQAQGTAVDLVTLKNRLVSTDTLEAAGGIAAVGGLSDGLPRLSQASVEAWADGVREAGRRRQLATETRKVLDATDDLGLSSDDILSRLQAVAFGAEAGNNAGTSYTPAMLRVEVSRMIDEMAAARDGVIGISSGLPELDRITGGFRPGQLVLIGARPSVGKSSLALQIAGRAADAGHTVAFMSMEMSAGSLATIRACGESQVSAFQIQISRGEGSHMLRLAEAVRRQAETPLYVERLSGGTLGAIRARASRIKAQHGLGMVVVDYLQLMRAEGKASNRNEEISVITRGLKDMAETLGCPVIVCAQLNREAADRGNARPRLSQFRDSGSIEADADIAILLHRPNETADRSLPVDVDLIVDKNRTGATGDVACAFVGKFQRFEPRDREAA